MKNNERNSGNFRFQIYIIEKYSEESLTNERLFIIGIMNLDMEMKLHIYKQILCEIEISSLDSRMEVINYSETFSRFLFARVHRNMYLIEMNSMMIRKCTDR